MVGFIEVITVFVFNDFFEFKILNARFQKLTAFHFIWTALH